MEQTSGKPEVEFIPPPIERRVGLGEEFELFDPNKTILFPEGRIWRFQIPFVAPRMLGYRVALETGLLPDLPFLMNALPNDQEGYFTHALPEECLTPFKPELGYQLTPEDWVLETRIERLLRLKKRAFGLPHHMGFTKSPYRFGGPKEIQMFFGVYDLAVGETLIKAGLANDVSEPLKILNRSIVVARYQVAEEALMILRNLRLQLSFPNNQQLEAEVHNSNGVFSFETFYPLGKPLPAITDPAIYDDKVEESIRRFEGRSRQPDLSVLKDKGMKVLVPYDLNQLKRVKAKFVLVREKVPETFNKAFE